MAYVCAVIAVTTHNSSTVLPQMFYTVLVETHPRKTHQPKPKCKHICLQNVTHCFGVNPMPHNNIMRIGKGVDLRGYYGYLHILRNFHTCDQAPTY